MTPEQRFETLVGQLVVNADVTPPGEGSGFGSSALRYRRKIFAMLVRGQLVVKLPKARVDRIVASQDGRRFDANKATPMREWLCLDPKSTMDWLELGREALEYARHR